MSPARCPDCGGALTDGHDDGRDLIDVWCSECGEEWTESPAGWARPGSEEAAAMGEVYRRMGDALAGAARRGPVP